LQHGGFALGLAYFHSFSGTRRRSGFSSNPSPACHRWSSLRGVPKDAQSRQGLARRFRWHLPSCSLIESAGPCGLLQTGEAGSSQSGIEWGKRIQPYFNVDVDHRYSYSYSNKPSN
jgi:hypothetical protein